MRVNLVVALLIFSGSVVAEDDGWVSLYNGKNLDGWTQKGGDAKYAAEGDTIVGTSVPNTANSFLCTEKEYGDFILEFEFKGHPELNSGVQIRSHSLPEYQKGRVHGYQCELEQESQDRDWSGGIYDEARRGWLFPKKDDEAHGKSFGNQGKANWKSGDWNKVRIEARGPRIRTWINDVPRADLTDDMTAAGFIALQVHGVGKNETPMKVYWRNLRLKEIED